MLSFAGPLLQYGHVYVFPDYGDPTQFYYLPNSPHIAMTEAGTPAIQLLIYKQNLDEIKPGDEQAVGFLSLDVDLSFPEPLLKSIRSQIQTDLNILTDVKLNPIFFRKGTARFLLLDEKTPEPGHENDKQDPSDFVVKLFGAASPSLYGDNRAIFQAMLSKRGTEAILGSIDGFAPIGVIYELTFAGLQPAYHIKVTADWHKVYDHFSEMHGYDSMFYKEEVEKAIDKLVESQVIKIEDIVEGVDGEADLKGHDAAVDDIKKYVFETFFKATLNKVTPAGEGITDAVGSTLNQIASAPFSIFGKGTYARKEMTDDELRSLEIDWSARKAAERTIYPQAHISTLFQGQQITRDQLVKIVGGTEELFKTISIAVLANAAWDAEKVAAISVELTYGTPGADSLPTWSFQLTKDQTKATRVGWYQPSAGQKLSYKYQVVFTPPPDGIGGPSLTLDSGVREADGLVLTLTPSELYRRIDWDISTVDKFPFDRVPVVEVAVRFRDEDGSFTHVADGVLKAGNTRFTTSVRARPDSTALPEVRYVFHTSTGRVDPRDWTPLEGGNDVVTDPFPNDLKVKIQRPDSKKYSSAAVEVEYVGKNGDVLDSQSYVFDDSNATTKSYDWVVHVDDPARRRYRYRMTLTYRDVVAGAPEFVTSEWIDTDRPQLPLSDTLLRQFDVQASLDSPRGPGVERVEVHLEYQDDASAIHEQSDSTLIEATDVARLTLVLKDIAKQSYSYSIVWRMEDGFDRKIGPSTTTKRYLSIPGSPPKEG